MDFKQLLKDGWDKVSASLVPWAIFALLAMLLSLTIVLIPTVVRGLTRAALDFARTGKEPEYSELFNFEDYLQYLLLCLVMGIALSIGYSLLIVPGLLLSTWWLYAIFFITDKREDFWPAMTASKDAVSGPKFVDHLILLVIIHVLNYIGGAICGLGLLISGPLSMVILAMAYDQLGTGTPESTI